MDTGLAGKHVLITGASGGIGTATVRAFAAEGAHLALHYNTRPEPIETLRGELDVTTLPVQADLGDEQQTDAMFARILEAFGRLDAVVANAGVSTSHDVPLHKMQSAQWHKTLRADLDSAFFTARAFLRHLADDRRDSASLVFVGSTAALVGEANHADYSAAKAGMTHGLTRSLKNEIVRLAPRGRVNCVCPGWTRTPMAEHMTGDTAAVARVTATMALQKIATPEDIAAAVLFLTSDRLAGHISGAIIPVAGGMEGRLLHAPIE
jgi:3-oxoacyl-[acyl-carrier protein] reductase